MTSVDKSIRTVPVRTLWAINSKFMEVGSYIHTQSMSNWHETQCMNPSIRDTNTQIDVCESTVSCRSIISFPQSHQSCDLYERYDRVNHEIERISSITQSYISHEQQEIQRIMYELVRAKLDSKAMIDAQKELVQKLMRYDKRSLRRLFTLNREKKVEHLKSALYQKLSASAAVDANMQRLQRQSMAYKDVRLSALGSFAKPSVSSLYNSHISSYESAAPLEDKETSLRFEDLEREKHELLYSLLGTLSVPHAQQLQLRIDIYMSEVKASDCALRQVQRCYSLYRNALIKLRVALSDMIAPEYTGTLTEFILRCYPQAIEAGRSMEAVSHVIQPESCRRYPEYAPEILQLDVPKFPQAVADYARRARVPAVPNAALALEGMRKLKVAENTILSMQYIALKKLDIIENWHEQICKDCVLAHTALRKLEKGLEDKIALFTRAA